MFHSLRKYFFRQKIKKFIKLATEAIYSEQFDMEILVKNSHPATKVLICFLPIWQFKLQQD